MTETKSYSATVRSIADTAAAAAGVPAYHSPQTSAGEKIIYRCTPGEYDGEWERFTVTMRFISRDTAAAFQRAMKASKALCGMGDSDPLGLGITVREGTGGSGFIGKTGHYFVLSKFIVKRRLPANE